jgi:hypothetical protein
MSIHANDKPRTVAAPPDRGMGWGIPAIMIAGALLAGLFAFKAMEDHTETAIIPISRPDRPAPVPADATTPRPSGPGATQ